MKYIFLLIQIIGGIIFYLSLKILYCIGFHDFAKKCMVSTIRNTKSGFRGGLKTISLQMLYNVYMKEKRYKEAKDIIDLISTDKCGRADAKQKYIKLADIAFEHGEKELSENIRNKVSRESGIESCDIR